MSWWQRLFAQQASGTVIGDPLLTAAARNSAQLAADLEAINPWHLPTVVAARGLCANTTAMMSLVSVDANGRRVEPASSLLRRPDPAEPYRRTLERIVNSMTRHGRAWLHIDALGSNNYPLAVHVVADRRVQADLDARGRLTAARIDGTSIDVRRLVRIPMTSEDDDAAHQLGSSPLDEIETALEQLAEVYRYSASYYTTAEVPSYAVRNPTRLTSDQAQLLSDQWLLARLERRPPVLSGGIELETYSRPSAADSLLLDAINYLDALVARVLLIPPTLLNVLSQSSLTYATASGEFQRWLTIGLYPMFLSRIEAAFTDLLPRGQRAVFDTSNLTRLDQAGRIATLAESIGAGIHTPAEARALEGLPADPADTPAPIDPIVEGI